MWSRRREGSLPLPTEIVVDSVVLDYSETTAELLKFKSQKFREIYRDMLRFTNYMRQIVQDQETVYELRGVPTPYQQNGHHTQEEAGNQGFYRHHNLRFHPRRLERSNSL
jgi:hypothetical protein